MRRVIFMMPRVMQILFPHRPLQRFAACCASCVCACLLLAGCESTKTNADAEAGAASAEDAAAVAPANAGTGATAPIASAGAGDQADVSFLLSMTWEEARKLSPQSLEVPPFYKVAADEVKVLKSDAAGKPLRVRAKGHVFMEVDFRERLTSLGQEAYIESGGELILRGKPLLQRGRSLVEGLSDMTVFYIQGTRLQAIGNHRLVKQGGDSGAFDVMPTWTRSWKEGPNPLLPALSPDDLPKGMRVNPLLPPPNGGEDGDNTPKTLPAPKAE
jgi:hypothetical protein